MPKRNDKYIHALEVAIELLIHDKVREVLNNQCDTQRSLARQIRMSEASLANKLQRRATFKLVDIYVIARAFRLHPFELLPHWRDIDRELSNKGDIDDAKS